MLLGFHLALHCLAQSPSELKLPAIIGSNMVVQQGAVVPIWGKTAPGRLVKVTFAKQTKSVTADATGSWTVRFRNLKAGSGGEMVITDGKSTLTFSNILVGDVWICSGQSNMEWPLAQANDAEREVRSASYDEIRLFKVAKNADTFWKGDVQGEWKVCRPETARDFSAVGYFFGRSLYQSEKAPVGLIDSSWGGTPAQAWTPISKLVSMPETRQMAEGFEQKWEQFKRDNPEFANAKSFSSTVADPGNEGYKKGWHQASFDDSAWKSAQIPSFFSAIPGLSINGIVWFRKKINVPSSFAGKPLTLSLGPIDDFDITYLNNFKVGETGASQANYWQHPRVYHIPAGVLKAGENTIAVRVHDSGGEGGIWGKPEDLRLTAGSESLSLAGPWKYFVEYGVPTLPAGAPSPFNPNAPSSLYSGMIKPLVPFALKGAIWYQGESNVGAAKQYSALFPGMIQSWREAFGQPDMAFLYVQLANFMARQSQPSESGWAELREAQEAALKLKKTGSAVIIDIGDADDIHPRNKKDVGERLAMSARSFLFPGSGPSGNSPRMERVLYINGRATVFFKDAKSLKTTDGKAPVGFAARTEGGAWQWATAKIEGAEVVLSLPGGGEIADVRYAWADNPEVNLVNELGLPVCPFRTDKS